MFGFLAAKATTPNQETTPMETLLMNALIKYLESHPDEVVSLISEAVQAITTAIKSHNAASATPKA